MTTLRLASLILLLCLSCVIVRGDDADDVVRSWMESRQIPGSALIVVKDGKIVKAGNYGYADLLSKTRVTDSTVFEIASMTKQFTAAAVMLLVEEKKLGLDESISKYLPNLPAEWSSITIRRLLDHTSGLYDDWDENNEYFQSKTSDEEFLDALKKSTLKFKPGERYRYSCGPFIVGMIVSRVTGMSYAEFMRTRIFEPVGMTSTYVNGSATPKDVATGYVMRDGKLQNGVQLPKAAHARGDVGISTTAGDLVKWLEAHEDGRFLKPSSLREIFAFAKLNDGSTIPSGLGWWLNPIRGEPIRHHGGGFRTGFNSTINWYPKSRLAVILLANRFRASANDLGHVIAGLYDPTYRPVSKRPIVQDTDPGRTRELYEMLRTLSNGAVNHPLAAKSFPYNYYNVVDWKELLEGSDKMDFRGCDDISKSRNRVFGSEIKRICFFQLNGRDRRPVSFLLDKRTKVVYIEPFEY